MFEAFDTVTRSSEGHANTSAQIQDWSGHAHTQTHALRYTQAGHKYQSNGKALIGPQEKGVPSETHTHTP